MKKARMLLALLVVLWGASALAQNEPEPWTFEVIDTDGDDALSADEFGTGLYAIVSDDSSGLSEDSYVTVVETYGLDPDQYSFAETDLNDDDLVTAQDEFVPGVASAVFDGFDLDDDAVLTPEEYAGGMLGGLDTDNNGTVTLAELERSAEWFGEPGIEGLEGVAGGGGADGESAITENFFLSHAESIDATEHQDIGGPGNEVDADY